MSRTTTVTELGDDLSKKVAADATNGDVTNADMTIGGAEGFERACAVGDLPTVGAVQVEIGEEKVAVVRDSAGDIHAIDDTCSHANVSLSEGDVEDGEIECWLHGSRFDLRSGKPTGLPAVTPIAVYPVKIDGGDVFVSVTKEN